MSEKIPFDFRPVVSENQPCIDIPAPAMCKADFGFVEIETKGNYTIKIRADDNGSMELEGQTVKVLYHQVNREEDISDTLTKKPSILTKVSIKESGFMKILSTNLKKCSKIRSPIRWKSNYSLRSERYCLPTSRRVTRGI